MSRDAGSKSLTEYCLSNNNFQCFQSNPLNRLNLHRKSSDLIIPLTQNKQARFLPFSSQFHPLMTAVNSKNLRYPVWLTYEQLVDSGVDLETNEVVLLGIGSQQLVNHEQELDSQTSQPKTKSLLSLMLVSAPTDSEYIYFAVLIQSKSIADKLKSLLDASSYGELRILLSFITVADASILAQGRALLDWHTSSLFCGKCGNRTLSIEGGARRKCTSETCSRTLYPRTDSVSITLVSSKDNERVLLGRKSQFPKGIYTCLAGFIESGESIEEACQREIFEESGVLIDSESVKYFQSQPWPFLGGQLMIGCFARADEKMEDAESVTLHDSELEDCKWFNRNEIGQMLNISRTQVDAWAQAAQKKPHEKVETPAVPVLTIPPPFAIAHQLIQYWYTNKTKNSA
ncbi:unnamed protein product [Didymodactylos carnosus]|uniref:NAD(+) diphosphatase n=1 Tax=Didymodactylos carnosus TaxID=1234261 RepID=A0A814AWY7_9BILA|nr:unnamed protein product [Didymodactylos carnosus]CAF0918320.1 unnamed protein product [Didymodactylos carnosus]CAF3636614.1 unnamed protein product [Didymodactylos carnosus]CAF3698105.1 unnamed protein product [Didymodactylos carnosus]